MDQAQLSLLSGRQLEVLYNEAVLSGDSDLEESVVDSLLSRDYVPEDYELLWALQDAGWHGGSSQEDRDSR